ncbi:type 4b pilus protein PilO2 [Tatumella saanichensis]|uniref:type 4b pilus protein PilO2 n=1 Tax=Tatumella saanichensis TaxID=480813 RepID=UPI0004A4712B|nr:type 4b pilus protein PilO2 [Tatumella saanichensis]
MTGSTAFCVHHRGGQWVLGLEWRYLPVRGRRKIRQRLSRSADIYQVNLPQEFGGEQGCLLGTTRLSAENKRRDKSYSLALAVLQQLPANSFAVYRVDSHSYWFVARIGNSLSPFSDYLGDAEEMLRHIRQFRMLSPPEIVWDQHLSHPRSDEQAITEALSLDTLLPQHDPLPRKYRLSQVANHRRLRLPGALILLAAFALSAWLWWNNYQQQQRIAAAQQYLLQQQQLMAARQGATPWHNSPSLADTLQRCQGESEPLPLFIAGWALTQVQCYPQGGTLIVSYRMHDADTIDDFIRQLHRAHLPVTEQRFNLPGAGDEARLQLSFLGTKFSSHDSPMGITLTGLVSLAQRTRGELQLSQAMKVPGGGGYREYRFTLLTALSPRLLLSDPAISGGNLVADSVGIQRTGGKLLMTLEGRIYEKQ